MLVRITALAAVLALSAACAPGSDEVPPDFAGVLPDERLLVNLPVDVDDGRRDGHWAEAYLFTSRITSDVNGLIGGVLFTVDAITTNVPPSWSSDEDNTAVWGPWGEGLDPAETALWVHHDVDADLYSWAIAKRPRGEESWDAFEPVMFGEATPGAAPDTSDGWFFIDFDVNAAYDPTSTATGRFGNEYHIEEDGVWADAGFEQFADDGGDPIDAWYHYEQTYEGAGLMDLAYLADVNPESGTGNKESHVIRSRWQADGAGRADALVGGGDLESLGFVGAASECWGTDFGRSYYENNWAPGEAEGEEADCVFADASYPEDEPASR